jgi:hypothetical protein
MTPRRRRIRAALLLVSLAVAAGCSRQDHVGDPVAGAGSASVAGAGGDPVAGARAEMAAEPPLPRPDPPSENDRCPHWGPVLEGRPCYQDSPCVDAPLEGELADMLAPIEPAYDEPFYWVDAERLQSQLVDPAQTEAEARIQLSIRPTGEPAVSFEGCLDLPASPRSFHWVPIELEVKLEDGSVEAQLQTWLQIMTPRPGLGRVTANLSRYAGGGYHSVLLPDLRDPDARYRLAVSFDDGHIVYGSLERDTPTADRPGWTSDPIVGRFPTTCDGERQLPIAESGFAMAPVDAIEALNGLPLVALDWGGGHVTTLRSRVEPKSETACHRRFHTSTGGITSFVAGLQLSTPDGAPVASGDLDIRIAFGPDPNCESTVIDSCPTPYEPIIDGGAELEVEDAAAFFAGVVPEGKRVLSAGIVLMLLGQNGEWTSSQATAYGQGGGQHEAQGALGAEP